MGYEQAGDCARTPYVAYRRAGNLVLGVYNVKMEILGERLPTSDGGGLILAESDVLTEECLHVRIRLRRG